MMTLFTSFKTAPDSFGQSGQFRTVLKTVRNIWLKNDQNSGQFWFFEGPDKNGIVRSCPKLSGLWNPHGYWVSFGQCPDSHHKFLPDGQGQLSLDNCPVVREMVCG